MAVFTLLQERPANPMEIVRFWGVRTSKPLNQFTKNLVWVIVSAIIPHAPKFKTIAPLVALQRMRAISPSRGFQLSFFLTHKFARIPRLNRKTALYAIYFICCQLRPYGLLHS